MLMVGKISWFTLRDTMRSRWGVAYAVFFLLLTEGLFRLSGEPGKALLLLMSAVIILVPLVSVILGTMYYYNSREFIEMLLTQPVKRKTVFAGLFLGLSTTLSLGFMLGAGLPSLVRLSTASSNLMGYLLLLVIGGCLTFCFVGLAFFVSSLFDDKGKGLGVSILGWLTLAVLYDGLILVVVHLFNDYPLEKAMIVLSLSNPIDLARILMLMQTDISALMGYTGAVFQRFFGTGLGMAVSLTCLFLWAIFPYFLGKLRFTRKDF